MPRDAGRTLPPLTSSFDFGLPPLPSSAERAFGSNPFSFAGTAPMPIDPQIEEGRAGEPGSCVRGVNIARILLEKSPPGETKPYSGTVPLLLVPDKLLQP